MIRMLTDARLDGIADMIRGAQLSTLNNVRRTLQIVGVETVTFLRSLTDTMRPPRKPGERARRAHPGGWADVTGNLANAYAYEVTENVASGEIALVLTNNMEYAATLEARDGFFVLSGVADRGGPVEQALIRILARVAPDVRVVYE